MSLIIKNLNKNFEKLKVLNNITIELKKSEITGLLGTNGAGKSTLMRILAGYYENWDGEISINGIDLKKELNKAQKITGYLPEDNPLYNEMYVEEYLEFITSLYDVKSDNFNEIIEQTGLKNVLNKKKLEAISIEIGIGISIWICGFNPNEIMGFYK